MNDLWETQKHDYNWIQSQLPFRMILDLAADRHNAKCRHYITEEENSLSINWVSRLIWIKCTLGINPLSSIQYGTFCNPPYSKPNLPLFTEKACIEAEKGLNQCFITPLDITSWSRDYVWGQAEVWIPDERMKFIDPVTGKVGESPSKGSMILIYGPLANKKLVKPVHIPERRA